MFKNKIALVAAAASLQQDQALFKTFFSHGSMELELYKPQKVDLQQPHERDEIYIIASGEATFELESDRTTVQTGDFLFVPARADHRFLDFTEDFSTWVIFYGPEGGE